MNDAKKYPYSMPWPQASAAPQGVPEVAAGGWEPPPGGPVQSWYGAPLPAQHWPYPPSYYYGAPGYSPQAYGYPPPGPYWGPQPPVPQPEPSSAGGQPAGGEPASADGATVPLWPGGPQVDAQTLRWVGGGALGAVGLLLLARYSEGLKPALTTLLTEIFEIKEWVLGQTEHVAADVQDAVAEARHAGERKRDLDGLLEALVEDEELQHKLLELVERKRTSGSNE